MNVVNCVCKYKSFTLFALIGIITILSQKLPVLDTFGISMKSQTEDHFSGKITNDVTMESSQAETKSGAFQRKNSTAHVPNSKWNDVFKVTMKPNLMELINPSMPKFALTINGSYLLEDINRCSSVSNLKILIMVLSAPTHFQRRKLIRETWANERFYPSYGRVKVVFLLGIINNSEVQGNIENEFKLFGDIVQGSFIDSYHNLSHKSVMGYKWVTERCRNAKYVIKTDDDIVINIFRILQNDIHLLSLTQHHVYCLRHYKSPIFRDKQHKFHVEANQFKGLAHYPTYCSGQFVMMLNDIVPHVYESASQSPLFWIDDIFVYGIVLGNMPGLKYRHLRWDECGEYGATKNCLRREKTKCHHVYCIIQDSNQATEIWSYIMKQYSLTRDTVKL